MNKLKNQANKQKIQTPNSKLIQANKLPLFCLVFFVITFLIYGQTLQFYLGKFDEDIIILRHLDLLRDIGNIKLAITRDAFLSANGIQFYRPLQTVSFMFDAQFLDSKGASFYFSNILLHAATCSALFYLLILLHNNWKSAFALTLLYLSSPLFVHAIAWIPSRGDLLIGLFGILSMAFFIKMIETQKLIYGASTLILFLAAMFSKETAIILPIIFLLYYLFIAKGKKISLAKLLITFAGLFLVVLFYLYLRSTVIKVGASNAEFGIAALFHNLRALPEYIAKFFIPFHLSPMAGFSAFNTVAGILLLLLIVLLTISLSSKPYKNELFGFVWFLLFAIPGAMYSHKIGSAAYDYLEHRAYLPIVGIVIILSFLHQHFQNSKTHNRITGFLLLLGFILGVYSYSYAGYYRNPKVFYDYVVISNPSSAMALNNRGLLKSDLKDFKGAMDDYEKALNIKRDYPNVYVNKGVALANQGLNKSAIIQYDSALIFEPNLFEALLNKANAEYLLGFYQDALRDYNISLKIDPNFIPGFSSRAGVYSHLKEYSSAEKDFSKVIEYDDKNVKAYINRGKMRLNSGNTQGACADWRMASDMGNSEASGLLNVYCK